ncbi:hypothetical protein BT69DRAFT_1258052 [Atractiella rhizophila]|nr:hypothetical protein BT69DRAFT_1258052 [Atractiella rhizophila]
MSQNSHQAATQLISNVPLIKAPSFWVPKPVTLPADIHPLPPDITAYFVYPHLLETHVLSTLPATLQELQTSKEQRAAYLIAREEAKKRRKKEELRKVAPGWDEGEGVLVPTKRTSLIGTPAALTPKPEPVKEEEEEQDPMKLLVDGLERLGGTSTSAAASAATDAPL